MGDKMISKKKNLMFLGVWDETWQDGKILESINNLKQIPPSKWKYDYLLYKIPYIEQFSATNVLYMT